MRGLRGVDQLVVAERLYQQHGTQPSDGALLAAIPPARSCRFSKGQRMTRD
jgi:hypothetical protein